MLNIRLLINALRELQRITAEATPDGESDRPAPREATRELDRRESDGIDVRLLWNQAGDQVVVAVSDAKTGDSFAIPVEPHEALTVFHHPYAYAASSDGAYHTLAV